MELTEDGLKLIKELREAECGLSSVDNEIQITFEDFDNMYYVYNLFEKVIYAKRH